MSQTLASLRKDLCNRKLQSGLSVHKVFLEGQLGTLRMATLADLKTVGSWATSARDCALWTGWRVQFPINLNTLPESLQFSEDNAYVWVFDAQVAGFGQIFTKGGGRVHLSSIIVDPALRRRGHGQRFLLALLQQARARAPTVSLNVNEQNATAISLYRRLGFADAVLPPGQSISAGSRYMENVGLG